MSFQGFSSLSPTLDRFVPYSGDPSRSPGNRGRHGDRAVADLNGHPTRIPAEPVGAGRAAQVGRR
jgi:hypothetical protein